MAWIEKSEDNFRESVLSFPMWVLGLELTWRPVPLLTEPSYWPLVWHYKISSEKENLLANRMDIDVELEGKQVQNEPLT